ncbi:hypothetical protein BCR35DRAFT_352863 [Leucosporidium creatinivorum]|uniref:Uncharacterized protein n=1 Tax=Leucosporidium creatinivorum TaxID=106004 RepID=A0A1Y2F6E2_9BASI|nr:hypothetical protein BCR35DRAFT_352863 [Leucosporidium creatinivorum]
MAFLTKSSLTFCTLNLLRLLSVVAILLALSGEIVTMVSDLKGVEAAKSTSTTSTTSSTTTSTSTSTATTKLIRRELSPAPPVLASEGSLSLSSPTAMATLVRGKHLKREVRTSSSETSTTVMTASARTSTPTTSAAASAETSSCAYIGETSVPKQVGGILFSTLERIFCAIILIFALLAEIPPHSRFTQRFWTYCFPPFGESFGTGVLGVVQVFVGRSALSHSNQQFPLVAFWFLFVVGFLNILFGLAFGASLKSLRSIFPSPSSPSPPSGLKSLRMNAAPHAGAPSSYFAFEGEGPATPAPVASKSKKERKPIVISPPMSQTNAPPVYQGQAREE